MAKKPPQKTAGKKRSATSTTSPKRTAKAPVAKKAPPRSRPAAKPSAPPAKAAKQVTRPATPAATTKRRPAPAADSRRPVAVLRPEPDQAGFAADGSARPTAKPLTREEVEEFRNMLIQKRTEITSDMHTLQSEALRSNRQDSSGDLSTMPIHMADLGSDNYELEFTLGLIEGERAILKEIDEALDRVRAGTYGLCLATGNPIGKARLKAKPWAKYSYEYTLAQERGRTRGL